MVDLDLTLVVQLVLFLIVLVFLSFSVLSEALKTLEKREKVLDPDSSELIELKKRLDKLTEDHKRRISQTESKLNQNLLDKLRDKSKELTEKLQAEKAKLLEEHRERLKQIEDQTKELKNQLYQMKEELITSIYRRMV